MGAEWGEGIIRAKGEQRGYWGEGWLRPFPSSAPPHSISPSPLTFWPPSLPPLSPLRRRGTLKELGFQVGSGFKRLSHVLTAHAEMRDAHAAAADRPPAHHDLSLMQAMCPCGGPPKVRC